MDPSADKQWTSSLLVDLWNPVIVDVLQGQPVLLAPGGLLQVHLHHRDRDPVGEVSRVQDPLTVDPQRVGVAGAEVGRLDDLSGVSGVESQSGATDRILRREDGLEAGRVVDTVREELDPEIGGGGEDVRRSSRPTK